MPTRLAMTLLGARGPLRKVAISLFIAGISLNVCGLLICARQTVMLVLVLC